MQVEMLLLLQWSRTLVSFVVPVLQPDVLLDTSMGDTPEGGLRGHTDGELVAA
jgi:hypothetical protein